MPKPQLLLLLFSLASLLGAGWTADAQPCPVASGDRDFSMAMGALTRCEFGAVEGNYVGARYGRYYNVYCPGRMAKSQAPAVAAALVRNAPPVPGNPIPRDFAAYGLRPRYRFGSTNVAGIHHWNHYGCGVGGVATHIKIEIDSFDPTSREVAARCFEVNRAGSVRVGGRLDVEYRCAIHFKSEEGGVQDTGRPPSVQRVARLKGFVDVDSVARSVQATACLLEASIQCAPCKSSDKLVVRFGFVSWTGPCPPGTATLLSP